MSRQQDGRPPGDPALRAQYEAYPYPARDPAEESRRLVLGSPSNLAEVNHYLFAGRRDFTRPFRALVAGGGTGDATIMLAQQLAEEGCPAEVVHLDLSEASLETARARAALRGLANIDFRQASLLDLAALDLGLFDYIDCCGVLHHLADPAAGLAALRGVLAPGGGMGLMLYGELGRRGVYETQALLRGLTAGEPLEAAIATARRLLASLPPSHWLKRNPMIGDHERADAELVDLLLHSRDRAFAVEEIGALIAGAGLRLVTFVEPALYEPATFLRDQTLLARIEGLSLLERAAFAEKLLGSLKTHVCYVTSQGPDGLPGERATMARLEGAATIPVLPLVQGSRLAETVQKGAEGAQGGSLAITLGGLSTSVALPPLAGRILARVDGRRDLAAIHTALQAQEPGLAWDDFFTAFRQLYGRLGPLNILLLRQP